MRLPTFSPNDLSPKNAKLRAAALPLIILLAALLLTACGQQDPGTLTHAAPDSAPASAQLDVPALLDAMLDPAEPGHTARFLDTLPAPDHLSDVSVRNLHKPSQLDTLQTWTYPGVELEVYINNGTGAEFIKSVRVEREGVDFSGLHVGMPLTAAHGALGHATKLFEQGTSETHLLTPRGAAPVQVTLHTGAGQLTAFTVHGYLD